MMHVLEPVPNIQKVRPDLPAGVEAVVAKAMAKEAKDRYSTARRAGPGPGGDRPRISHNHPISG